MIKNIIFDLGGVLMNYLPDRYIKTLGFDAQTEKKIYQIVCTDKIWEEVDTGEIKDFNIAIDHICLRHKEYEKELRRFFSPGWMQNYYLLEDGMDLFHQLVKEKYHIYLLSNFSITGFTYLKNTYDFFKDVEGYVVSSEVGLVKPDPRIYNLLIQKYHLTPQECLFIDDREENVFAAKNCDIHGICYVDKERTYKFIHENF